MRGYKWRDCLFFGVGARRFRLPELWVWDRGLCRVRSRILGFQMPIGPGVGCGICMFLRPENGEMGGGGWLGSSLVTGRCVLLG